MVDPKHSRGDVVSDEHIHGVVAVGQHDEDNPQEGDAPRDPMERPPLLRRVLLDDEGSHGQDHRVTAVDVVPTVDVLAVDGQSHA